MYHAYLRILYWYIRRAIYSENTRNTSLKPLMHMNDICNI